MPVHRRCVFVALAFVAVLYMCYKYKLAKKSSKGESTDEEPRSPNVTTKFDTKVIPLKPPRNDSYSKALSIHYKFNYSHPQYDDEEEEKENDDDPELDDTLTVITFNVLATCYALTNSSYQLYCPSPHLQGHHRFTQIGKILRKCDADLICLQEVDQLDKALCWMDLHHRSNHKYKVMYHKRTNKKQDGLLFAYKHQKYQLYKDSPMRLIQLNDLTLGCASQNSQQYFKKDQIAIYTLLQPLYDPSHVLFVMNTHLYWHPEADNVRLRQLSYLLNIIQAKANQIRHNDADIAKISLIFCGDFNTLPGTSPHSFVLNGEHTMEGKGNVSLKLMMDSALNKVARWTRSLGVDVAYYAQQKLNTINANQLFQLCKEEDRILITRSKNLVARRECPAHLLLNNHIPRDNLKQLIKYFGIEYDDDAIYTRCTLCNGLFEVLEDAQIIQNNEQIPQPLKEKCDEHTFWKCLKCAQTYWFGEKSQSEVEKFKIIFDEALAEMDKEIEETKEKLQKRLSKKKRKELRKNGESDEAMYDSDIGDLDEKLKLLPNLQRFFWENVTFNHPFGNRIKSSYQEIYGKCPEYTNKTNKFSGCLDYIFYADLIHNEQESIRCIDSELMEGDRTEYPNSSWPSDHILLMSTFQLQ